MATVMPDMPAPMITTSVISRSVVAVILEMAIVGVDDGMLKYSLDNILFTTSSISNGDLLSFLHGVSLPWGKAASVSPHKVTLRRLDSPRMIVYHSRKWRDPPCSRELSSQMSCCVLSCEIHRSLPSSNWSQNDESSAVLRQRGRQTEREYRHSHCS